MQTAWRPHDFQRSRHARWSSAATDEPLRVLVLQVVLAPGVGCVPCCRESLADGHLGDLGVGPDGTQATLLVLLVDGRTPLGCSGVRRQGHLVGGTLLSERRLLAPQGPELAFLEPAVAVGGHQLLGGTLVHCDVGLALDELGHLLDLDRRLRRGRSCRLLGPEGLRAREAIGGFAGNDDRIRLAVFQINGPAEKLRIGPVVGQTVLQEALQDHELPIGVDAVEVDLAGHDACPDGDVVLHPRGVLLASVVLVDGVPDPRLIAQLRGLIGVCDGGRTGHQTGADSRCGAQSCRLTCEHFSPLGCSGIGRPDGWTMVCIFIRIE